VIPTTAPQDARTSDLITHLRSQVIPTAEKGSGLHVLVGGGTAIFDDFATVITSNCRCSSLSSSVSGFCCCSWPSAAWSCPPRPLL